MNSFGGLQNYGILPPSQSSDSLLGVSDDLGPNYANISNLFSSELGGGKNSFVLQVSSGSGDGGEEQSDIVVAGSGNGIAGAAQVTSDNFASQGGAGGATAVSTTSINAN